jgi:CemA family
MFAGLSGYWQDVNEWFFRTPDRALDEAYKAALKVQSIEDENGGQKIEENDPKLPAYLRADLQKYLRITKLRLTEFQTSRSIDSRSNDSPDSPYGTAIETEALVLEKLQFIDWILERYSSNPAPTPAPVNNQPVFTSFDQPKPPGKNNLLIDATVVNTFKKIRQDLSPAAEQEIVSTFRASKDVTKNSLRFLLTMILIPLLVHFMSKFLVVGPIVDYYYPRTHQQNIFINSNLEKEALEELERFERHIKFQSLTGAIPKISTEQLEEQVKEKASFLRKSYTRQSSNSVKNWFADLFSVTAFIFFLTRSKRQIANLLSFMNEMVSGLSDSAKVFVIILFTDTFVGFHSPHGWEVVLAGMADHWGIAENHNFNSLFIATFPVLLDTVFKFWVFRYLSGQSPSSVAIYKSMNE